MLQRIPQQQEQQQTMHQAQTQPPNSTPQMQGQPPNQTPQMQAQPAGQMISNQGQRMMLAQPPQGNWQPDQQQNQLVPPQQQTVQQQNVRPYGPAQGLINQLNQGQGLSFFSLIQMLF